MLKTLLSGVAMTLAVTAHAAPTLVRHADLELWTAAYLGTSTPRRTPLASPVYADLKGLPPFLIQVGSSEVLLSDSHLLADRLKEAGVSVNLHVWPEMIHVWHWFAPVLSEGRAAIDELASFLDTKLG